jgi:hypothetical protein
MLLAKYCRPHDATKLFAVVIGQLAIDRNEHFLDATLAQLRDREISIKYYYCGRLTPNR